MICFVTCLFGLCGHFGLTGFCVVRTFVVVGIVVIVCLTGFGFDFGFACGFCLCDLVFCCALRGDFVGWFGCSDGCLFL